MAPSPPSTDTPGTNASTNGKPSSAVHNLFQRKSTKKGKETAAKAEAGQQTPDVPAGEQGLTTTEQATTSSAAGAAAPAPSAGGDVQEGASATGDRDNPSGSAGEGAEGQDPNLLSSRIPQDQSSSSSPALETAEPPTSSTLPVPEASAQTQAEELDKDKGSANTVSTPSQAHAPSRRQATTSEGAQSSTLVEKTSAAPKSSNNSKAASTKSKRSFLSKLVRVLLPCVPTSKVHEIDTGDAQPAASTQGAAAQEKEPAPGEAGQENEKEPKTEAPEPAPATTSEAPSGQPAPPEPLIITPPTPPEDPAVIVPPTPTKLLPEAETEGVTSGAVQPPGSTGEESPARTHQHDEGDESDRTSFTEEEEGEDPNAIEEVEDEEDRLILQGGAGIPTGPDGLPRPLLPPIAPQHVGRKCLVLDLDETLVHSSFKSIQQADYVVPVEIEYHWHNVYVIKRPGVDNFLKKMGEIYEVVVFTASLSKYADPVLDKLDIHRVVTHRLFRESCYNHRGNYVKDLSQLGRPIADTIILDNSPASYIFHPNNAVPVSSWFNDPHDTELTDLCPFLADLGTVDDVRGVLDGGL